MHVRITDNEFYNGFFSDVKSIAIDDGRTWLRRLNVFSSD